MIPTVLPVTFYRGSKTNAKVPDVQTGPAGELPILPRWATHSIICLKPLQSLLSFYNTLLTSDT